MKLTERGEAVLFGLKVLVGVAYIYGLVVIPVMIGELVR